MAVTPATSAEADEISIREMERLRAECDRLRKERDNAHSDLDSTRAQLDEQSMAKLTILSNELSKKIQEEFISTVKTILWIAGVFVAIGSLGGFLTVKDLARHAIDEEIQKREAEFKRLSDTELDDVIRLRTQTAMALESTQQLITNTRNEVQHQSRDISKQTDAAKKLILDTTAYWEAAKPAIERAKGKPPSEADKSSNIRDTVLVTCLKDADTHDPDVDLFYGVIKNDVDLVKGAMARGGNPVVTIGTLIARHRDAMKKYCPGLTGP